VGQSLNLAKAIFFGGRHALPFNGDKPIERMYDLRMEVAVAPTQGLSRTVCSKAP
jgi:hypothetical protein